MNESSRRIARVAAPFALASLVMIAQERWGATPMAEWAWSPPRVLGLFPDPTLNGTDSTSAESETPALAMQSVPTVLTVDDSLPGDSLSEASLAITPAGDSTGTMGTANSAGPSAVYGHLTVPRGGLRTFLTALDSLQQQTLPAVRVAHCGDSQIEGDRFTMYLRRALQEPFGNYGVGYVPIISEVAKFRVTVRHQFSNSWKQRDRRGTGPWQYGTGPAGLQFLPAAGVPSTASYQTQGNLSSMAIGLAPSTEPLQLRITFGPTDSSVLTVPTHATDTVVTVRSTGTTRTVTLQATGNSAFYGVWLQEGNRGVAVGNYSRRGSAGDHLLDVSGCAIERTPAVGSTRLVILMFGINVLTDSPSSYGWYGARVRAMIATLRHCFPATSVVIIGPALRGVRDPLGVRESRGLAPLARALRQAAVDEGVAYWDQTGAMRQIAPVEVWASKGVLSADLAHYSDGASRQLGRQLAADLLRAFRAQYPVATGAPPGP